MLCARLCATPLLRYNGSQRGNLWLDRMKYLWALFLCLLVNSSAVAQENKQKEFLPPAAVVEAIAPKIITAPTVAIPEPSAEAVEAGKNVPAPANLPGQSTGDAASVTNSTTNTKTAVPKTSAAPSDRPADGADSTEAVPDTPLLPSSAYIKPSWPDLLKTMAKFNALDLYKDDRLLDEYAMVCECGLYGKFYQDDFKWQKIRGMMRDSISQNHKDYPVHYFRDVKVQLNRYNFDKKLFEFTDKSVIHNVNAIYLLDVSGAPCVTKGPKYMPARYRAVLNEPISINGLSIEQDNADALLKYLKVSKNDDRILTGQINMTVGYVQALTRVLRSGVKGDVIYQQTSKSLGEVRFDVKIDSVDFFADADKKIKVFTYVPQ